MSTNGYRPRHNPDRAERLATRTPLRGRVRAWLRGTPWTFRVAVALTAVNLTMLGFYLADDDSVDHSQHNHAAAEVRYVTDQHCLEALSAAETAMDAAQGFGESMASFHTEALALAKFLAPGDAGRPVRQLQEKLRDAGWDIEVDGSYGPKTRQAVEEFREKHGKHAADSETFLAELADTREAYAAAAEQCEEADQ